MEPLRTKIDYRKISQAIDFYISRGFELIEVPWVVSKKAMDITMPEGRTGYYSELGGHVGSAEQSFLQMILDNKLNAGKYMTCSPCFREDSIDEIHHKWFMKLELIDFPGRGQNENLSSKLQKILENSLDFFSEYLDVKTEKVGEGTDIVSSKEGIELGSYGIRHTEDFSWIYGTGLAEPRLSYVLSLNPRGYHLSDIPRSKFESPEKIEEEVLEFMDALKQKNRVMSLIELSDILGSIEGYLNKEYKGTISLNDLMTMKEATSKAFRSGRR